MTRASRSLLAVLCLATIGAALAAAPAGAVTKAPAWRVEAHAAPTHLVPDINTGANMYLIQATNTGGAPTDGSTITVTVDLPAGFSPQPTPDPRIWGSLLKMGMNSIYGTFPTPCDLGPPVTCQMTERVDSGERLTGWIPLQAPASGPATVTSHVTVSGGGAAPAEVFVETPFDTEPVPFGIQHLEASLRDADGTPMTQAGAHPFSFRFGFDVNTRIQPSGGVLPAEHLKDLTAKLPPGFVVDPTAAPYCTEAQLQTITGTGINECPEASAVGAIQTTVTAFGFPSGASFNSVYNMVPPPGSPAELGFMTIGLSVFIHVLGNVDAANGYSLKADTKSLTQYSGATGAVIDLWGDPSDPVRDWMRGSCDNSGFNDTCPVAPDPDPFLTMPTACSGPPAFGAEATFWQSGETDSATAENTDAAGNGAPVTGCGALDFDPTLLARPTTNVADSPSGLDVDLQVPQDFRHDTLATAHLRKAVVTLPEGLVINPAAANGLGACSSAQIGLTSPIGQTPIRFSEGAPSCPAASRVGSVEVTTPLVDHPLPGSVYIAAPFDNPFDSLLAIYIVIDDPQTGVVIKLAGHTEADPDTGQLVTTFDDNPQVPFSSFRVNLKSGAHGVLRTPSTCGDYSTTSELTPWSAPDSGPPADPRDDYSISQGPSGACATSEAEKPNAPSFDAGTVSPIAGAHSPFVVHLRRNDGSQQFSAVTVNPPQGLVAKLAGTTICPDSALAAAAAKSGREEKANPSCPASSEVGAVVAGAGAGPSPYHAPGKAYMSGPYKGAPLSFAIITPATAGPFDLGTVVVKTAIHVDPKTAKITAVSDPLPTILEGIVLDVRTIDLALDKPNFTLNPTNCDPMAVEGLLTSTLNQVAQLSSRFQLGECGRLGFKPRMTLRLRGGTKRGKHPALTIALMPRPGDANIASVSVALPRSEFLENAHIRTVCTRPDFAADNCPAGAIYGEATVDTSILDYDLSGHVYLRTSDNLLPDIVPDLRGPSYQPIRLETAGRTDSVNQGIRNTIDFVPDAPFTKAIVALQGGNKGLLVNSRDICGRVYRATVRYTAHNGFTYTAHPALKAQCGKGAKKGKKRRGNRRAGR